jgi:hypothetical protein
MNQLPAIIEPPRRAPAMLPPVRNTQSGIHTHLPGDLASEITSLYHAYQQAKKLAAEADGKWGPIGWDAVTGLIPGVGGLYTAFTAFRLQRCAAQGRCGFTIRATGILLAVLDIAIGVVIGVGDIIDALFRSSAIHAGMIQSDIARRLHILLDAEDQIERHGYLTDADITRLRDVAFRGGRSELGNWLKNGAAMLLLLLIVYSCSR